MISPSLLMSCRLDSFKQTSKKYAKLNAITHSANAPQNRRVRTSRLTKNLPFSTVLFFFVWALSSETSRLISSSLENAVNLPVFRLLYERTLLFLGIARLFSRLFVVLCNFAVSSWTFVFRIQEGFPSGRIRFGLGVTFKLMFPLDNLDIYQPNTLFAVLSGSLSSSMFSCNELVIGR